MLPCDIMEDDPGSGRRQFVPQPEVLLMAVDGHLECQESQHQEVVLHRENTFKYEFLLLEIHTDRSNN